jgi:TonB family protein
MFAGTGCAIRSNLIFLFLFFSFSSFAKDPRIIYFDEDWNIVKKKADAFYYIEPDPLELKKTIGHYKYYYITGELQWEGDQSGGNNTFTVRRKNEGLCTWYFKNGFKKYEASYRKGEIDGIYSEYYEEDGKIKLKAKYLEGKKNGFYLRHYRNGNLKEKMNYEWNKEEGDDSIWYENGALNNVRHYHQGIRTGKYSGWYVNGVLSDSGIYVNDSLEGSYYRYFETGNIKSVINYRKGQYEGELKTYWPNGKLKRLDIYGADSLESGNCYDSLGAEIKYFSYAVMPEFPGGDDALNSYLAKKIIYPKSALNNSIQGRVIVQFVVDTAGNVTDVSVSKGVSPSLNRVSLEVVSSMPRWIPGKLDGEPVKVSYRMPIKFTLR